MLYLVTGTPGTGKTSLVVTKLDKIESQNKVNLVKNKAIYEHNQSIIDKHNLQADFGFYEYETGTAHTLKREIEVLSDDYFFMFQNDYDDLRPDDYFLRSTRYNEIITKIAERDGIKDFKLLQPVRTIYSNIANLKIDYVRALEYDWRLTPDGSIHVIDEVQLVDPYCEVKAKPSLIQDLTIHRHRGFDFYFLTQAPSLLHPTVKELIGCHYHLTKPYGVKTMVYQFGSCRPYPNTMANKLNAETKFSFSPPARIYKLYKSTTINTHEKRFPLFPLLKYGALISVAGFMVFYGLFSKPTPKTDTAKQAATASVTSATVSNHVASSSASTTAPTMVEDAEMIKIKQQIEKAQLQQQLEQLKQSQALKNIPSNVIAFGSNCTAYNSDGLPFDMSLKECKQYATGKKPILKVLAKSNTSTFSTGNSASIESIPNVASIPSS